VACVWRWQRALTRQAPGISDPHVLVDGRHWRIALCFPADQKLPLPLSESMDRPVLVSNPTHCGVRRDSGLQSLQSGGDSIAVRLPNDNRQRVDQQLRIPSFRYKIGTTE
jgi:hypothetical protein